MQIESVVARFPSRRVTNADVLDLIRVHSEDVYEGDLDNALGQIHRILKLSGASQRFWLDEGETPIELIKSAVQAALEQAELKPYDIDLLIYVGVGKGFMEPGQAHMVAHSLGWEDIECFDVLDACMSWMRALNVAQSLLRTGRHKRIMVVNGEFSTHEGGCLLPGNYRLRSAEQLQWTFPSYTIGCAATATILTDRPNDAWEWRISAKPQLADLCTIPGNGWQGYSQGSDRTGRNGIYHFASYGIELHKEAFPALIDVFQKGISNSSEIKILFTHSSSYREWKKMATAIGLADRMSCVYPHYGNVVSASIPAALALALEEGRVERGDRLAFWMGSAGMSFAACSMRY